MPVVGYDTNVLLSAIGWRGAPFQCLELARCGTIQGVTCKELLDEFEEKLTTKLNLSSVEADETIADLLSFLHVVKLPDARRRICVDPDDDVVLECAVAAEANYLVTGDRRHLLPMKVFEGIEIISVTKMLELFNG